MACGGGCSSSLGAWFCVHTTSTGDAVCCNRDVLKQASLATAAAGSTLAVFSDDPARPCCFTTPGRDEEKTSQPFAGARPPTFPNAADTAATWLLHSVATSTPAVARPCDTTTAGQTPLHAVAADRLSPSADAAHAYFCTRA